MAQANSIVTHSVVEARRITNLIPAINTSVRQLAGTVTVMAGTPSKAVIRTHFFRTVGRGPSLIALAHTVGTLAMATAVIRTHELLASGSTEP